MSEKFIEDRIDTLEGWQETYEKFISTLGKRIEELFDKVAKLETGAVCDPIILEEFTKQIDTLQKAQIQTFSELNRLSERTDVGAGRLDKFVGRPHQAGKPAFNGGWINLYYTRPGRAVRVGALNATRQEADIAATGDDHRIACIYIPDFPEGEGL